MHANGKRLVREVATTSGYLAGQSLCAFFGLGDTKRIERVEVFWPSGQRSELTDVVVNQRLQVVEGSGAAASR